MVKNKDQIYNKFIRALAFFLMILLAAIVVISTLYLIWSLIDKLVLNFGKEELTSVFINFFGLFLLVLVNIELLETLRMYTKEHYVRVETILLVGIIAIARKIIVLDYTKTTSDVYFGIAAVLLTISISYYLLKRARLPTTTKEDHKNQPKP